MDQAARENIVSQFTQALPYARLLKMSMDDLGEGFTVMSMPYDARLVGDPETGVLHTGAVYALIDTAGGGAVMCHPAAPTVTATLDLRIDHLRAATPEQRITCRAECYHVTRSVGFVRVEAWDDDRENPIATATGAFTADGATPTRRSAGAPA